MPMIRTRRSFAAPLVQSCTGTNRCQTAIPAPGVTALQRRWHRSRRGNKRPSINHSIQETTRSNACAGQKSEPRCRSWRRFVVSILQAITQTGQAFRAYNPAFPNRKQSWSTQAGQPVPETLVGSIKACTGDVSAKSGIKKHDLLPAWICHGRFTRPRGINHEPHTNHAVSPAFPSPALREQEAARKGGASIGKSRQNVDASDVDPRRKSTGRQVGS